VFWGVVLLRESLSWAIVIGMAIILAGTVLTNVGRRVSREPSLTRDTAAA
jgi:drug/metabolite transporter (DMT)-like permease